MGSDRTARVVPGTDARLLASAGRVVVVVGGVVQPTSQILVNSNHPTAAHGLLREYFDIGHSDRESHRLSFPARVRRIA